MFLEIGCYSKLMHDTKPRAPVGDSAKESLKDMPEIRFMDGRRRAGIMARSSSFHISLPPDDSGFVSSRVDKTHLHSVGKHDHFTLINQKLRVIAAYSRAVVVEFENRSQRDAAIHLFKNQKYSFGPRVLFPDIQPFEQNKTTEGTAWCVYRAQKYSNASVHEALRRFFCLEGLVRASVRILNPLLLSQAMY